MRFPAFDSTALKQRLSHWRQHWARWRGLLTTVLFQQRELKRLLDDLFIHGGIEIITTFPYQTGATAETAPRHAEFKTLLQADGDMLHFLPRPDTLPNYQREQQLQQHSAQHREALNHCLGRLDAFKLLGKGIFTLLGGCISGLSALAFDVRDTLLYEWGFLSANPQLLYFAWLFLILGGGGAIFLWVLRPALMRYLSSRLRARFGKF